MSSVSQAILRIGTQLKPPLGQLAALGFIAPVFLRDILYDQVANNRCSSPLILHLTDHISFLF